MAREVSAGDTGVNVALVMAIPVRWPQRLRRAALCLALCASVACYESAFPLDPLPQGDLDQGVPGRWHCVSSAPGDRDMTLTIAPTRSRVYAVTFQEFGHELDRYEAHLSLVAGVPVVNLRSLEPDAKPWTFLRYLLVRPNTLEIRIVDGDQMKGVDASPERVRQAIAERVKDASLFADLLTCVRMKAK